MNKNLELFFEKLLTDSIFRDKFLTATTAREGYELAKIYIPDVSFEEFKEGVLITERKLKEEIKNRNKISNDDMRFISGGIAHSLLGKWAS